MENVQKKAEKTKNIHKVTKHKTMSIKNIDIYADKKKENDSVTEIHGKQINTSQSFSEASCSLTKSGTQFTLNLNYVFKGPIKLIQEGYTELRSPTALKNFINVKNIEKAKVLLTEQEFLKICDQEPNRDALQIKEITNSTQSTTTSKICDQNITSINSQKSVNEKDQLQPKATNQNQAQNQQIATESKSQNVSQYKHLRITKTFNTKQIQRKPSPTANRYAEPLNTAASDLITLSSNDQASSFQNYSLSLISNLEKIENHRT